MADATGRGPDKTRRRPDCSGAALSVRPGGQESHPAEFGKSYPFMHSLCALARSSAFIPAVFLLHIAILLSFFAGLADRQVFMNALRSSPVLPVASALQAFIFSCCGV